MGSVRCTCRMGRMDKQGRCCWWLLLPKMNENYARKFAKVFEGLVHQCSHLTPCPLSCPFMHLSAKMKNCPPSTLPQVHMPPYQSTWFTSHFQSVCLTRPPHLESDGSSDADAHLGPAWDHKIWGHSPSSVCPRPRWRSLLHHLGAALNPHHHVERRSGSRRRGGHPNSFPRPGKRRRDKGSSTSRWKSACQWERTPPRVSFQISDTLPLIKMSLEPQTGSFSCTNQSHHLENPSSPSI